MYTTVALVTDLEEFVSLVSGTVRCRWSIDFLGDSKAVQTIYAEAPSREGGFVVYRRMRYLDEHIVSNLERMHGVRFDGDSFEKRALDCCQYLFEEFMRRLSERLGGRVKVSEGRYLVAWSVRPIVP